MISGSGEGTLLHHVIFEKLEKLEIVAPAEVEEVDSVGGTELKVDTGDREDTKNIGTDSEIVKRVESEPELVFGRAELDVITVSGIEFEIVISGSWEGTLLDKVVLE